MAIEPQYFTPRPSVTAVVQLTEGNRDELVTFLNGIFAVWNATATDAGFQWRDTTYPGGRTLTAAFGQYVVFTPAVYSGSGVNLGATDDDPTTEVWNQAAPSAGAGYAFETPAS